MSHSTRIKRERWRHGLIVLALLCAAVPALAQDEKSRQAWEALEALPPGRAPADHWIQPEHFRAFNLDAAALRESLRRAPGEFAPPTALAPEEISLPMPDGSFARFTLAESPVMAPELAAKFPEIKTYCGRGLDDPQATVRFDWTPAGFHAQILSPRGAVYIDPPTRGDSTLHVSYFKRDYRRVADGFVCLTATADAPAARAAALDAVSLTSGGTLRTYRLACAATGEYTLFHGGTVALGLAAIVTAINRVTGVYETELGIRLVLVPNNNLVVFTNGDTDPYSNSDGIAMLSQNQSTLDSLIGNANYDIGHVFSTGGGGVAVRNAACSPGLKANGVTGSFAPVGDAFWIDFVAHEMGHQFGASHTFNGSAGNCGGTRAAGTAYEPGSGSTIMAYAGICLADNLQPHSDPYFHFISLQEINSYVTSGGGASCPVATATSNSAPILSAGPSYAIPKNTPFTLTAVASDPDGHPLTYCWEERDLGVSQPVSDPDNGSSPIFRSFPPVSSPARTFPRLSDIVNNTSSTGEKLPATSRTLNFRVTARDNRPGGGAFATADMQVIVNSNAGPFALTAPNTSGTLSGTQTVTWNVAGTASAPVNTAAVNILLSTNGGLSFPITLRSNAPNTGSASVLLPNISTPAARIKVEAAGNIFFDVSDANFTITPAVPTPVIQLDSTALLAENCWPPNGVLDPDETVTLSFTLKNVGTGTTTNLVATLLPTGGVTAPGGPQTYGVVQATGPSVTRPFTFTATGTCGGAVTATLQLQDGSLSLGTVTAAFVLGTPVSIVTSFSNTNRLALPASGNSGAASLYPSSINVSNLAGVLTKVTVTLSNLAHATADDLDLLLVGPTGQAMILLSDAGGTSTAITNVTLTFDDAAPSAPPNSSMLVSGTFLPVNYGSGDAFAAPAPAGPYASTLSSFNGLSPNGVWSLYVVDDASNGRGTLVNGWTLNLTLLRQACCSSSELALTLSESPDPVVVGGNLTYTIIVTNKGPAPATGVVVSDALPAGIQFIAATASQGGCSNNGGTINCQLGTLTNRATATIILTTTTLAPGSFTNTAMVASSPADALATNNVARAITTAHPSPPLLTSVSVSGGNVTLTWSAVAGATYRLQYTTNLSQAGWNDIPGDTPATGPTATKVDDTGLEAQRFYRLIVVP